jgi:hypothetical protein
MTMTRSRIRLTVYDPTGAVETTQLHARRLDTLAGKTICEISNSLWEHDRIFPAVREALQKRVPTAKLVPYTEMGLATLDLHDVEKVSRIVKEKGCHAVITGMAA